MNRNDYDSYYPSYDFIDDEVLTPEQEDAYELRLLLRGNWG